MAAPLPGQIAQIFRDRVERAKRVPPEDRLRLTLEHSDCVMELMKSGVRAQFPDADESRVNEILRERFALMYRIRNQPVRSRQ